MSKLNPLLVSAFVLVIVAIFFIAFVVTNNALRASLDSSSAEVSKLKNEVKDLASLIVIEQDIVGIKGDPGPTGEKGEPGEKGETGAQGVQGPQGPQGVQGAKGDKGDQGVAGMSGYEVVWGATVSIPNDGTNHNATIQCPSGKRLLSVQCNSAYLKAFVISSYIIKDYPNMGACSWKNGQSTTDSGYVVGICANLN